MPQREDPAAIDQTIVRSARDAVWSGDGALLQRLLTAHPGLAGARISGDQGHYCGYFFQATLLNHCAGNPTPDQGRIAHAVESARLLLAAGAAVDARTGVGPAQPDAPPSTTLCLAVSAGDELGDQCGPLVDLLVAHGADVDDQQGLPMACATYYHAKAGMAALLVHGARLDARFAANCGNLTVLQSFFNPDGSLRPGANTLHRYGYAAPPSGRAESLDELLLFATNDVNPGTLAVIRFLLRQGARPLAVVAGRTPLHAAAMQGDAAVVALLLAAGHGPLIPDDRFHATAEGWASHFHHTQCAKLIRDWAGAAP